MAASKATDAEPHDGGRIASQNADATSMQERFRAIIDRHDTTLQEMRVMIEQLHLRAEDLRSSNDELLSARREVETSYERLAGLNRELQRQNAEMSQLTDDLNTLLLGADIPIIVLSPDLTIRCFTPSGAKVFHAGEADVGRLFTGISSKLDAPDLGALAAAAIDQFRLIEREVRDAAGCWYSLRIRPWKTRDNKTGVVLALFDIDTLKRNLDETRVTREFAETIVETLHEPRLILDAELRVVKATRSFYEVFQLSPDQVEAASSSLSAPGNGISRVSGNSFATL